jgi:hypothetical protein
VRAALEVLTPEGAMMLWASHGFAPGTADECTEEWYGQRYSQAPMPAEWIARCDRCCYFLWGTCTCLPTSTCAWTERMYSVDCGRSVIPG